jgi:hypothetical protein
MYGYLDIDIQLAVFCVYSVDVQSPNATRLPSVIATFKFSTAIIDLVIIFFKFLVRRVRKADKLTAIYEPIV